MEEAVLVTIRAWEMVTAIRTVVVLLTSDDGEKVVVMRA